MSFDDVVTITNTVVVGASAASGWMAQRLGLFQASLLSFRKARRWAKKRRRSDADDFEHPWVALSGDTFGMRVRERRTRLGLTQREIADRAGMTPSLVGRVERGHRPTTQAERIALLEALSVRSACDGCPYKG